ncbi:hypothetical protein WDU94_009604 [Cyamophila willieti]
MVDHIESIQVFWFTAPMDAQFLNHLSEINMDTTTGAPLCPSFIQIKDPVLTLNIAWDLATYSIALKNKKAEFKRCNKLAMGFSVFCKRQHWQHCHFLGCLSGSVSRGSYHTTRDSGRGLIILSPSKNEKTLYGLPSYQTTRDSGRGLIILSPSKNEKTLYGLTSYQTTRDSGRGLSYSSNEKFHCAGK